MCSGETKLKFRMDPGGYVVIGMDGDEIEEIVIPSEHEGVPVVGIGRRAFEGSQSISAVYIPESIETIGFGAFSDCWMLSEIFGMQGVRRIEDRAFLNCNKISAIFISASVTEIGSSAFAGCFRLIEVWNLSSLDVCPGSEGFGGVARYAKNVFRDERQKGRFITTGNDIEFYSHETEGGLKKCYLVGYRGRRSNLRLPESFEGCSYDINNLAFCGFTFLESVHVPSSVNRVYADAFEDCTSLKKVHITDLRAWTGISFENEHANPLYDGNGFLYLNGMPLGDISIPDGTEEIGTYAFAGSPIKSVTVPRSVRIMKCGSFFECRKIGGVYIEDIAKWCGITFAGEEANPLSHADMLYVNGKKTYDLEIPEGVIEIGRYAFFRYKSLFSVTLPRSLESIGGAAFYACTNLMEVRNFSSLKLRPGTQKTNGSVSRYAKYVYTPDDHESKIHVNRDGYVFFDDREEPVLLGYVGDDVNLILPSLDSKSYRVLENAFSERASIESLTIPSCVESIEGFAFYRCGNLTSVKIEGGVKCIKECAFYGCSKLARLEIGNGLKYVGTNAFSSCEALSCVRLSDGLEWIDDYAFFGRTGDKIIILPSTVKKLGNNALNTYYRTGVKRARTKVFYLGGIKDWEKVDKKGDSVGPKTLSLFFYSEKKPRTYEDYVNSWHWDEDGNPKEWQSD